MGGGSNLRGALERLRFGPLRTLNVRAGQLSGAEAARRVDRWLRSKQVELTGEVHIITGRGAGSPGGIPVVRDASLRTLRSLVRQGVIRDVRADTAGSFIVRLAPLRALLEAPARRRTETPPPPHRAETILGLETDTRVALRTLAVRALESLGVGIDDALVTAEMERQFTVLVRAAPTGPSPDRWLRAAMDRALLEYNDALH